MAAVVPGRVQSRTTDCACTMPANDKSANVAATLVDRDFMMLPLHYEARLADRPFPLFPCFVDQDFSLGTITCTMDPPLSVTTFRTHSRLPFFADIIELPAEFIVASIVQPLAFKL